MLLNVIYSVHITFWLAFFLHLIKSKYCFTVVVSCINLNTYCKDIVKLQVKRRAKKQITFMQNQRLQESYLKLLFFCLLSTSFSFGNVPTVKTGKTTVAHSSSTGLRCRTTGVCRLLNISTKAKKLKFRQSFLPCSNEKLQYYLELYICLFEWLCSVQCALCTVS